MKLLLIAILGFVLVGSIGTVSGITSAYHQEVNDDDSLTFAEKQIQKQNCNAWNDRSGASMLCVEDFGFELNTVERNGMYYEQVVDLGTKLLVNGEGACNSGVELKLKKNGSNVVKSSTTYAFFTGEFTEQYVFSHYTDVGKYTLTAIKEKIGEEHSVTFYVKPMYETISDIDLTFEDVRERIITFENRLSYLESQLEKQN
ncbi:MAG: hypothetical protein COA77_05755 [Thaumarchaeota archaeon]|nr:MAG: hypothetical protein COA77_05755 [Nitrososphaerota archaeon]